MAEKRGDDDKKGGFYQKIGNPTDASEFPTDLLRQIYEETNIEFPVESDPTGKPIVTPQTPVVVPKR
jgi:hypothetical protein